MYFVIFAFWGGVSCGICLYVGAPQASATPKKHLLVLPMLATQRIMICLRALVFMK